MSPPRSHRTFIDLFAGCGGLSLGLFKAGWQGLFAVEKDPRAFSTLAHNLMGRRKHRFAWPAWFPKQPWNLEEMIKNPDIPLARLHGRVGLLAGGPPCQGFSKLGKRWANDPRNQLFRHYLEVVRIIHPKLLIIENVDGIQCPFGEEEGMQNPNSVPESYADLIIKELDRLQYKVWRQLVYASDYGVPQARPRVIFIGALKAVLRSHSLDPFEILTDLRSDFLTGKGLSSNEPVTAEQAIADLHTEGRLEPCPETRSFKQGRYGRQRSAYQQLMHGNMNGALADSHRLANHRPRTKEAFDHFIKHGTHGKKLTDEERGVYLTKKHTIIVLHPDRPAPTLTTLPDDLLHYREPRILTVRENARLQSFPDWFEFKGKYTTGGKERVKECPRYTQVGNAVPPLLAEAVGRALLEFRRKALI